MRNVSIFSSKYQKKEKRKKIIRRLLFVLFILVILFFIFRNPISSKIDKVKSDISKENQNKQETILPETKDNSKPDKTPIKEDKEFFNIFKTSFDEEIKVIYEEENGEKTYKEVIKSDSIESDISPSKKAVVILEKESQDLFYMDIEGNVTDITYKTYQSTKGYKESKESVLKRIENFTWARNPKFLNDDIVVYLSNLPWFDEREFLYVVELDPLNHYNFQNVKGIDIQLLELTEKGLLYEVGGKKYYLTEDFKIIEE